MRIDVDLDHRDIDRELADLWVRLKERGDVLRQLPIHAPLAPNLVFRYREVDGEFYVYAEDPFLDALAGCTVFNRMFEVDASVGAFLRSPHSRYASAYRRKGVATAVYAWALQAGMWLVSGPRQSTGAHRLWEALGRFHERTLVQVADRRLRVLEGTVEPVVLDAYETRVLLAGVHSRASTGLNPIHSSQTG